MAAYPSHNVLLVSSFEEEDGVLDDFTPEGGMHSRIMYATRYYRFRAIHQLTLVEWKSLKATYGAGKRDTYTGFTWFGESPALTYDVQFTGPPRIIDNLGLDRFMVEVPLRGSVA